MSTNIRDAARRVLDILVAADAIGPGTIVHNHDPDADMRALAAALDARCPGLIQVVDNRPDDLPRFNSISIYAPSGSTFDLYNVLPACYEPAVPHDYNARWAAYHALLSLAGMPSADDLELRPHPEAA